MQQHFLHQLHAPLPAAECAVERAGMWRQEEAGVPQVCPFFRPVARRAVLFGDYKRGAAGATDSLESMYSIVGKGFGARRHEDDVDDFFLRQDVGLVEPRQKGGHACAVGDDGDVFAADACKRRLKVCLPLGDTLAGGSSSGLDDGITDRPAVYPHFRLVRVAYQEKRQVFEFESSHFRRPI